LAATLALLLHGCAPPPPPVLVADPHYVLGVPYQVGTVWYYPREDFDLDETGLATIVSGDAVRLTSDGEVFDQTALAGGHASLQLPAIAWLTNLENGRQVMLRINDRGTGDPRRLIEVTRRTALLLAMPPDGVARVRLRVLPNESHAAAEALPGAPKLALTAAPRLLVEVADLPPPAGSRAGGGRPLPAAVVVRPAAAVLPAPPMRLPEVVWQIAPRAGQLTVRLDTFDQYHYAAVQQATMAAVGARIVKLTDGRRHHFRVEVGPLPNVAQADAVLQRALAYGIPDARIVVD
jgi:rare lipoprotein A